MKMIRKISAINTFAIPGSVKAELNDALTSPFDSQDEAESFWDEENCFLILIEPTDSVEELESYDSENGGFLNLIVTYPESVSLIGNDPQYRLALAITGDSGSGAYLLIPTSHSSRYNSKLTIHINNQ